MASKPLRLRGEVIAKPIGTLSAIVASVWVDSGVFHLDSTYSYAVPTNLCDHISVGSLVEIDFHGRVLQGLVVSLETNTTLTNLSTISKVLGLFPYLDQDLIELVKEACQRWATSPFDLLRTILPSRVISVEKEFLGRTQTKTVKRDQGVRSFLQLAPQKDPFLQIAALTDKAAQHGGVLIVVPHEKEISWVSNNLSRSHLVFSSKQTRSVNYRNFLKAKFDKNPIVIGNRSALFLHISNLQTVIIYRDGDESHYERQSPGWNSRDISLLRNRRENFDLIFVGYSPSTELLRLIDEGYVHMVEKRRKMDLLVYQSAQELIPSKVFKAIRSALRLGSVLFLVPKRGYADSITCSKCRNIALCQCGAPLKKLSSESDPSCSLCGIPYPQWSCRWCSHKTIYLLSRGSHRYSEEIGLSFPNHPIVVSTADSSSDGSIKSGSLVVATSGSIPPGEFSLTVILMGDAFFNSADLRSIERSTESIFNAVGRSQGSSALIIDHSARIITALSKWDPSYILRFEMKSFRSASLPPYCRSIRLECENSEAFTLSKGLSSAIMEKRLPSSVKMFGPTRIDDKTSRIILTSSISHGQEMIDFIHELQRKRSIAKKKLLRVRIDPYSIQ